MIIHQSLDGLLMCEWIYGVCQDSQGEPIRIVGLVGNPQYKIMEDEPVMINGKNVFNKLGGDSLTESALEIARANVWRKVARKLLDMSL